MQGKELGDHLEGLFIPSIQVNSRQQGFEGRGKDGALLPSPGHLFPLAQQEVFPQGKIPGNLGQPGFVHHGGPEPGEASLRIVRVPVHDQVADDQVQDRIAQKLQALVVLSFGVDVFMDEGFVPQPLVQEIEGFEAVPDLLLQRLERLFSFFIHK